MKKRVQGLIAGVLIGTVLTSGIVFSKQASETITVIYDNIKILIDGKEYQPTDVDGNVVEPFIYNGTTYLPVRAIANAFDKEVDWEAQTSTVTLGSKNYDWLDQMGYADYYSSTKVDKMYAISEDTVMTDKSKYDRGLKFFMMDFFVNDSRTGAIELDDGSIECVQTVSYLLNNNYKNFEGIISTLKGGNDISALIKFYGDGKLIYTSPIISNGMKSTKFNISVDGFKLLKIKVEIVDPTGDRSFTELTPCIADARLSKK